jgi:uncharacterized protein YbjT (DUF2867 family)
MDEPPRPSPVLVTGATGYIGGLLVPALLERGIPVRVLSRSAGRLGRHPWAGAVDVVEGDAGTASDLDRALSGVEVAYYLLHSMDGRGDFVSRDRRLAETFAAAARRAGVRRIVYLSGLHPDGELSPHLGSRVEVGRILLGSGVPTVVLQAGVVLGAGSASFDMLRHLTERLPAMVAPKWLRNRIQPIAIADVLHYLVAAAGLPGEQNRTFDIGGPDVLTYAEMIAGYAKVTGLGHRLVVTVPVLTPGLASLWVGLVTPVVAGIARPLVGSLIHEAVAKEDDLAGLAGPPPGGPTGFEDAVRAATAEIDPTRWRRTITAVGLLTAASAVAGSGLGARGARVKGLGVGPGGAGRRGSVAALAAGAARLALFGALAVAATATITERAESGDQQAADRFAAAYLANLVLAAGLARLDARVGRPLSATLLAVGAADLARRARPVGTGKAATFAASALWWATTAARDLAALGLRRRG